MLKVLWRFKNIFETLHDLNDSHEKCMKKHVWSLYYCIGICYARLFEAAKIHVQIMRISCRLNMAITWQSLSGPWFNCMTLLADHFADAFVRENVWPFGLVFKQLPRDPANVNAGQTASCSNSFIGTRQMLMHWNKHVWSLFLHNLPDKQRWKRRINIKYPFSFTWFLKKKWRQRQLSNVITSPQRHIYACNVSWTKASAKWSVKAATHFSVASCIQIRAQFRLFQVKAMFKQYVNLMIRTWILRLQTASCNEFPCKNCGLSMLIHVHDVISLQDATSYDRKKTCCIVTLRSNPLPHRDIIWSFAKRADPDQAACKSCLIRVYSVLLMEIWYVCSYTSGPDKYIPTCQFIYIIIHSEWMNIHIK